MALVVKNSLASTGDIRDTDLIPGSGRSLGEGNWQPTPVFLSGEAHGQRSLLGYSPWGRKELDTTEQLTLSFSKRVDNEGLTVGFALSPTWAQRGPRLYVYHNVSHLHTFIRQSEQS